MTFCFPVYEATFQKESKRSKFLPFREDPQWQISQKISNRVASTTGVSTPSKGIKILQTEPIIFHEISLFSKMAQIRKTIFFLSKYSLSLGIGGMFIYPKFTDIFNILFKSRKHWIFSASFLRKKLEWNAKLCNVRWWFYVTEKDNSPYCQIAIFFSLFLI